MCTSFAISSLHPSVGIVIATKPTYFKRVLLFCFLAYSESVSFLDSVREIEQLSIPMDINQCIFYYRDFLFVFLYPCRRIPRSYLYEGKAKYIFPPTANKLIVLWLKLFGIFQTRAGKLFVLNSLAVFCYVQQMLCFTPHW